MGATAQKVVVMQPDQPRKLAAAYVSIVPDSQGKMIAGFRTSAYVFGDPERRHLAEPELDLAGREAPDTH